MGVAILFILICFFFVPFMMRWDKRREARVEELKERLKKIGLPEQDEEDDFVEEIDSAEEALTARIVLPRKDVLETSVEPVSDSVAEDLEKNTRPDSATNKGAET